MDNCFSVGDSLAANRMGTASDVKARHFLMLFLLFFGFVAPSLAQFEISRILYLPNPPREGNVMSITVYLDHLSCFPHTPFCEGETVKVESSNPAVIAAPPGGTLFFPPGSGGALWHTTAGAVDRSQGFSDVTITAYKNPAYRTSTLIRVYQGCTAPVIQPLASQTIEPAQGAIFIVSASGTSPLAYQWFLNGSPVAGQTGTSFNTGPLSTSATVFVRVTNSCGSTDSNTASITMRCTAPSISVQPSPASQIVDSGGSATLTVGATGTGALTYEWYEGASPDTSRPLGTTPNSTFTTPQLYGGDKTMWVRIRNSCGFVDSTPVNIRLKCNLNVSPRFLQTDPRWAFNIYDGTTSTIGDLGSALTTLSMGLRYAGASSINTPTTKALDPGSLNDFMKLLGTSGYDSSGNVLFFSTTQFVGPNQVPPISLTFTTLGAGEDGWDSISSPLQAFGALDVSLCAADPSPVVVRVKSLKSGQYPSHYVLVTGKDINSSGIVKYTVADPAGFGTDLNSAPYIDAQGKPEFRTRGAVLKVNPAADQSALEVSSGSNASILVLDSTGRQTGLDSVSGKHVANIPRSATYRDRLSNSLSGVVNGAGHSVQLAQPSDGSYRVVATGVQPGPYELQFHGFRKDGTAQAPVSIKGSVAVGSSLTFAVNHSSTAPSLDVKQVLGDTNGDAKADCADIAIVRISFGKRLGQAGFDPRADIVVDNVIDVRDLNAVAQRLPAGTVCGPTLTVTKAGLGSGEVTSAPVGVACGATCSGQFKEATQVTLTAKPATNSSFAGWSGACSGTAPTATITMSADRSCTAQFELLAAPPMRLEVFEATSSLAAHPTTRVEVPVGYKIVGGGVRVNWTGYGNYATQSYPEGNRTWVARAKDHRLSSPASITAFAVTVYDPRDEWDVNIATATSSSAQHPRAVAAVLPGYVMSGGGARATLDCSQMLTASFPSAENTWEARSKDHLDPCVGTVTAYAIGVRHRSGRPMPVPKVVARTDDLASHASASVALDSGYVLTGGGALVNWSGYGNLLTASYPSGSTWRAASKDHEVTSPATITVYVIGLQAN